MLLLYIPFTLPFTFHAIFHLCSLEHLLLCHFYFANLSFSFLLKILNNQHEPYKTLMILGLFGYYPWHYGVLDFLDLGLETLAYLGDFVTLFKILSGVLEVYLKTLGCLFVLCAGYCDYILCL